MLGAACVGAEAADCLLILISCLLRHDIGKPRMVCLEKNFTK